MAIPIEYLIEEALAAALKPTAESLGVQVYYGVDESDVEHSCIVVNAIAFEPIAAGELQVTGEVTAEISVLTNFGVENSTREKHIDVATAVRDALMDDNLILSMTEKIGRSIFNGAPMLKSRECETRGGFWKQKTTIIIPSLDG